MARFFEILRPIAVCALAVSLLWCAGCGGRVKAKEGRVEDLISKDGEPSETPLAIRALKVEKVATDLEPQKDEYRIGPNDILNILVLDHEEFSSVRDFNKGIVGTVVKKDGNIYLPIIGAIKASGYTVEEFYDILYKKLAQYVKEPKLSVDMLVYESQKFYVLGEVGKPGAYPVDGDTTLLEAIGLAQGLKPEGSMEQAYVVRGDTLLPINLADLLLRGDTSRNIYMKHGDLVYVPPSTDQSVYVLGEVREPKTIQIPQGRLSLAQALSESGGILPIEADEGSIKLIRGSWQEPTVYTLKYETILTHGDRILLKPGDRIVVQPTMLTTASRYMQQILPFLVGADHATNTYGKIAGQ